MGSIRRTAQRAALLASVAGAAGVAGYLGLITAAVPVDLGVGRRRRPLGPLTVRIAADRDTVFDILAAPYLGRQTRALAEKIQILERGSDMVLAAHRTPVHRRLTAITVETVRFTRPERVDFFLVRGPVPEVVESFTLTAEGADTVLAYDGSLGTDLWGIGQRWGNVVADPWERSVASTFAAVKAEAERRTGPGDSPDSTPG
jgi:hypothetical protein